MPPAIAETLFQCHWSWKIPDSIIQFHGNLKENNVIITFPFLPSCFNNIVFPTQNMSSIQEKGKHDLIKFFKIKYLLNPNLVWIFLIVQIQ